MALASGDVIVKWAGWVTLESSGASISGGAMSAAATTECTSTNHEDAPLLEFGLEAAFGANAPVEGTFVELYIKVNTITGVSAEDGSVPTTAHKSKFLASARMKATTGTQYLHFGPVPLPAKEFNVYVYNGEATDAMTWQLYMNPRSSAAKA